VRVIPPIVPLLTVLIGLGLGHLWPIDVGFELAAPTRYWVGGTVVLASFLGLGIWSVLIVRRSGQRENPWKPTTHILTNGPFRITRNPMYLQMVAGCVGFAILFWNAWILLLNVLGAWVLQRFAVVPEEEYLARKFGEEYLEYKRRVRRWI